LKRKLRFLAGACLFTATALFSGCSSDDDFLMDPVDSGTSQTRAVTNPDGTLTITFDDFDPGMLDGVITYGNQFGSTGVATPLKEMKGYFQVNLECYDANGGLIRTYKRLLADYRNGQQQVDPITTWDYWEINAEGVQSVKFNFEGSDSGAYGLNTPAYICIDDITIQ
jgi:hypothetical protein